ncbi:MAG: cupin domain-containing protein [Bacteroidales bacterium]|jgi:uncharacterized cupin superfamily protein|nr:cupin domain-containing protein [Bacteroidales bacterium]HOL98061.1 cupin domain-containing protein [Bacteroidales bacterium]HOM37104.1 cupin domain-containing protein [Bacteroidales bacterium]HPD23647.1 cupin domain-containing protein [Bacteroidales bacterium]HRS99668.1 cupin domain-containing protein [Bacteroidales bacterium]
MVKIEKLTPEELKHKDVFSWPTWEKEISEFEWYYDVEEHCYFIEGEVEVITKDGVYKIQKGDYVIFPQGLSCTWRVLKPVYKHYRFL